MILIFGGAYQGKLDYVREKYGVAKTVFHCTDSIVEIDFSCDVINSLHLLVLAQFRNGINTEEYLAKNMDALQAKIIISDDISCGVVPVDREMRLWREATGRAMNFLARHSNEVVRIFCGLGAKLK